MKNVFDIPKSLREAIEKVASIDHDPIIVQTSWRRDLDIRPLVMIAGLKKLSTLTEVYSGKESQFHIDDSTAGKIHSLLELSDQPQHVMKSLIHYSQNGSKDINNHLWEKYKNDVSIPDHILQHISNISSALKSHTPVNGLTLYTGVHESPATTAGFEWNSTRPIKLLHLPAFTSSSTNFNTAVRFTAVDKTSIHHESDHHGIILPRARHVIQLNFEEKIPSAASMIKHSTDPQEEEVLLGPNHSFELHPRPTLIKEYEDPVYVWKAISRGVDNSPMFKPRDFTKRS